MRLIGIVLAVIGLSYLYMYATVPAQAARHSSIAVLVTAIAIFIAGVMLIFNSRKF
ncbi:MAG: hypothetical protein WC222_11905 [Parachlamydiales bacterium]